MAQMSANQIVALNLRRARRLRGWSQQRAGEAVAPYLGETWSKARWSAAERADDPEMVRGFDANELAAFSLAFGLPVVWFLMPPPPAEDEDPALPEGVTFGGESLDLDEYLAQVYPGELGEELTHRAMALVDYLGTETQEAERERLRPILFEATRRESHDVLALIAELGTTQKFMEENYKEMTRLKRRLEKVVKKATKETLGQKGDEEE